jgi:arylsulfatase A-like enzyme
MRFYRAPADGRTTTPPGTPLPRANVALFAACVATLVGGCGGDKMPTGTSGVQDKSTAVPTVDVAAPPATLVPSGTAASATASAGASATGVPDDMNVLVLGVDSLRVDHLPVGGAKEDVMPNLTAFEKTAVSYTHFYSVSSYTSQTLGAFLGARYPEELQRSGYFFGFYPDDELFFPELLQKAGVRTMSAQAHFYFAKEKSGFDQGFDVYELVPGLKKSNTTDENITSPAHTDLILKQLGDPANTGKRFFAWYHLLDPHDQYMGHPEGKDFGRGAEKMYDGELYFVDMHLKKIFDYVDSQPWGKKTMIIVTSDHGEAFGEHKMYRHGFELWNMLTHVPLMIRAPGVKPRRIDTPRSGIDLPATILDVFHVAPDPSFHGESLVPELAGGEAAPRDVISDLARTSDNDRRRSLIRGNWKIIEGGDADGFQLFDLAADPEEKTDLARKEKAKFEEMREALKAANKNIKDRCPKNTEKLKGKKKTKPC